MGLAFTTCVTPRLRRPSRLRAAPSEPEQAPPRHHARQEQLCTAQPPVRLPRGPASPKRSYVDAR